jgi:nitroreductase
MPIVKGCETKARTGRSRRGQAHRNTSIYTDQEHNQLHMVIGRTANPEMDLYSAVCAVQNLWLAARAENLGTGWVSIVHHRLLREALGIPDHIVPIAYLCIGYVSAFRERPELESAGWLPRLDLQTLVHRGRGGAEAWRPWARSGSSAEVPVRQT